VTAAASSDRPILTPDQRPRVFVSSTLQELAPERAAARAAIERLRLIPVMFELGARPHPARALYRAYLAQSHVFVGLYFERYGWVAPGESISGLEDEYRLSGALPRLVYLKTPATDREPGLKNLIDLVRSEDTVSYKSFGTVEELEQLLSEDLAVLMGERFLLDAGNAVATPAEHPVLPTTTRRPIPVPVDSMVGRDTELADLEELLASGHRLVSVVGPGGIGKTRLALEAARRAAADNGGNGAQVAFVPLETVDDPAQVLPAVATAIGLGLDGGIRAADGLAGAFGERPFLLVLDNLEQVLPAATDLAELLSRCPGLVVLATTRVALRVRGETLLPLGPLSLPGADTADADSAAVRLFVERATAVRPGFSLSDPQDAAAVAELCRRLDGVPLAIELAAGRSRLLPPRALLDRLGSALDLGSGAADLPGRQRTLRDTLAWSEQLLEPRQRDLLAALSVFSAPWTVADADRVAPAGFGDVLDDVAALVENSLVAPATSSVGEPRLRMFDTVRAYASERLDSLGGRDAAEDAFYAGMIGQVPAYLIGGASADHARWRAEFELVWPDLRRAWALAVDRRDGDRTATAAQLVVPLWVTGRGSEAADLLARSVELAAETNPRRHGQLVVNAAMSAFSLGDYARSADLLATLETGAVPPPSDLLGLGWMTMMLGYLSTGRGDLDRAEQLLIESDELLQEAANGRGQWIGAFATNGLGSLNKSRGDAEQAQRWFERSRLLAESSGNVGAHIQALAYMADLAVAGGRQNEAHHLLQRAVPLLEQQPYYEGNGYCLESAAAYATVTRGPSPAAARALGMAKALRDLTGARVWPLLEESSREVHTLVRASLDDEAFDVAFAQGLATDPAESAAAVRELIAEVPSGWS
jgi:predicted ATPase